jgi:hypothetical protein
MACNVSVGDKWSSIVPTEERVDTATGEVYVSPDFNGTVDLLHNRSVFRKVVKLVKDGLEV